MKPQWCDRTLIANPFYFTVCTTERMFLEQQKALKDTSERRFLSTPQANATTHFLKNAEGETCIVVCIPHSDRDGIVIAGLLVHEAVHIWQEIRSFIGEDSPSSEFEAYAIQWISQQLMWEYCRQVNK